MTETVKIYVACHKPFHVPEHPFLFPIQVGAALAAERFPGMIADDSGENISAWNRSYCELTAQYWAWKNDESDWQGFFHYRRYLDFRYLYQIPCQTRPYWIAAGPKKSVLQQAGYEPAERLLERLRPYEAIVPLPEEMGMTVTEQYFSAPHHYIQDLQIIENILFHGDFKDKQAVEQYFNGTKLYFGNLFLMRRALFERYCAWLFPLLTQYDFQKNVSGYSPQALRVDGYLAERLLGVFLTRLQEENIPIAFVPRIHFSALEGSLPYWRKKVEYLILPPSSKRRSVVRRLLRKNIPYKDY